MKILITGAKGQLGNELRVAADRYPTATTQLTDLDLLDICNPSQVDQYVTTQKPDLIINCAAYTNVDKAESEVDTSYKINRDAVGNLAVVAREKGIKIVHISTDYVFDGTTNIPYTEDIAVSAQSVYGKSKAAGEQVLLDIMPKHCMIIRTSWLYSSFGNNFMKTMLRLGAEKNSLSVVFDQVGTPTNASDLANAILHIITSNNFTAGIYHYSNEGVCSWYDFAKAIMDIKNLRCKVLPILSEEYPTAAPRPKFSVLNKQKIKKQFGIEIPHWHDSLKKVIGSL